MIVAPDVMPKAKKARKLSLNEETVRPYKANMGVMSNSKGRLVQGHSHPGVPKHVLKAVEGRRKHTLTGTRM